MHPARFAFLATKHKPRVAIIKCERNESGHWDIKMACGHDGSCVGHMTPVVREGWPCFECGEEYVRNAPQYANEFKE